MAHVWRTCWGLPPSTNRATTGSAVGTASPVAALTPGPLYPLQRLTHSLPRIVLSLSLSGLPFVFRQQCRLDAPRCSSFLRSSAAASSSRRLKPHRRQKPSPRGGPPWREVLGKTCRVSRGSTSTRPRGREITCTAARRRRRLRRSCRRTPPRARSRTSRSPGKKTLSTTGSQSRHAAYGSYTSQLGGTTTTHPILIIRIRPRRPRPRRPCPCRRPRRRLCRTARAIVPRTQFLSRIRPPGALRPPIRRAGSAVAAHRTTARTLRGVL